MCYLCTKWRKACKKIDRRTHSEKHVVRSEGTIIIITTLIIQIENIGGKGGRFSVGSLCAR